MRRLKYWLFLARWVPALAIALLFTGILWLVYLPRKLYLKRRWKRG
ncbi:MAG: hypothetical protein XD60_1780 [Acetothermia bacterium 64_32]|nr:MAG: hypothetical protein XD60_1780 [Acetothermia bacterium 64_32]